MHVSRLLVVILVTLALSQRGPAQAQPAPRLAQVTALLESGATRSIMGMDARFVERREGDARPPEEIISDWIAEQSQQPAPATTKP